MRLLHELFAETQIEAMLDQSGGLQELVELGSADISSIFLFGMQIRNDGRQVDRARTGALELWVGELLLPFGIGCRDGAVDGEDVAADGNDHGLP